MGTSVLEAPAPVQAALLSAHFQNLRPGTVLSQVAHVDRPKKETGVLAATLTWKDLEV